MAGHCYFFLLLVFLIIGMASLQENINLNLFLEQLDPIADKILVTFIILALSIELSSIFIGWWVELCL
jgi:hypothetical protein